MNAVKLTPTGGQVEIHVRRMSSYVEIVVSDTGQGIAPHILPFIFERFTQADSSSTRAYSGLGLGLALVKLAEQHGGSVTAESAGEGKGAMFMVKLPLAPAQVRRTEERGVHTKVTAASPSDVRLDGMRVLVVDDDTEALDVASAILGKAGAAVRSRLSARDALEVLGSWQPDVLVSDIEMPVEDGYSLIRKVRAPGSHAGGGIPAVAVTGYERPEDRRRALAAGFTIHLPKPVDHGELTTIIASLMGRTPHIRDGSAG